MDWNRWLRDLVRLVLVFVILPVAAWGLVRLLDSAALLLGAALFASPMFATMTYSLFESSRWRRPYDWSTEDDSIYDEVVRYGRELDIPLPKILLVGPADDTKAVSTAPHSGDLLLWAETWRKTPLDLQRYFVAQAMAEAALSHRRKAKYTVSLSAVILIGAMIASLNPWLIIPMHIALVGWTFYLAKRQSINDVLESDSLGLMLTRDYETASSWIGTYNYAESIVRKPKRLERLREAAKKYDLTA
jgi:hypothetical protein